MGEPIKFDIALKQRPKFVIGGVTKLKPLTPMTKNQTKGLPDDQSKGLSLGTLTDFLL